MWFWWCCLSLGCDKRRHRVPRRSGYSYALGVLDLLDVACRRMDRNVICHVWSNDFLGYISHQRYTAEMLQNDTGLVHHACIALYQNAKNSNLCSLIVLISVWCCRNLRPRSSFCPGMHDLSLEVEFVAGS